VDTHHSASHSGALLQRLLNEQHHFPLKAPVLCVPIATEGRVVEASEPVLVVGAEKAGRKDLQRHGQGVEDEVHPCHGLADEKHQGC